MAVLVTVIQSSGSTPRGAGAQMAVFSDGASIGTIGGGALWNTNRKSWRNTVWMKRNLFYSKRFLSKRQRCRWPWDDLWRGHHSAIPVSPTLKAAREISRTGFAACRVRKRGVAHH
ncbi:MAG: XdhC family protein [Eubacteriaceae bacterium]|nr:XdhC family protein [Eubacteriaceae bacterium]